ncbi:MAG: peptidase M15 [SAR86 cluster bacterium]|uniref:D-alanyl-D-alanine dipeptidase n=1 Tax=SAR86 cluster bacterium TaxID=2030880 RepID=A0A2A5B982_9GAMM|nr:MAG: peptidase M15 [SAR86 cluster bacterium]
MRLVFTFGLLWMPLDLTAAMESTLPEIPNEFVDIQQVIPNIILDVRYFTADNFVGEQFDGYDAAKVYLTIAGADALRLVQLELNDYGLGLKVFDGYRPQMAVDHFVRWAKDLSDIKMKQRYYPSVEKKNLFRDGYIASRSGHSRGSTIDLTLVSLNSGQELDMGTRWDFFDLKSWPSSTDVGAQQRANRLLLRGVMINNGFRPLEEEWWHFTLVDEPFPDRYFNFPIQ